MFCQTITTIAGTGSPGYSGDGGFAVTAQFYRPFGITIDKVGNMYIADNQNHRIRKITPGGIISTIAGTGSYGYSGDGGQATAAAMSYPHGIAVDTIGNVYFVDVFNHCIRKITNTGIISTFAGTGSSGYSGDGGQATAANLRYPESITIDVNGNFYITEPQNYCIRKITNTGIISTFAGTGSSGYSGDGGQATAARLNPADVAIDRYDNVYIADYANRRIRMVNSSGIISTVVGTGSYGYSGDDGAATASQLSNPAYITFDTIGNLYICDQSNNVIRRVNTSGIIRTYAGTGTSGYSGDGGQATAANLNVPNDIIIDGSNNLIIVDGNNSRIRKVLSFINYSLKFTHRNRIIIQMCENSKTPLANCLTVKDSNINHRLIFSEYSHPINGNLILTDTISNGDIVMPNCYYTPNYNYIGVDSFSVKVSDGIDYSIIKIIVNINPQPTIPIISGPSSVCIGCTINLTSDISGGVWLHSDANASVDNYGNVTGLASGHYLSGRSVIRYLSPSNSYNCKVMSYDTITITRFKENNNENNTFDLTSSITLYPNPNNGNFTINGIFDKYEIFDFFGKLILSDINKNINADIPNGIYIIKIYYSSGKNIKLLLQKQEFVN